MTLAGLTSLITSDKYSVSGWKQHCACPHVLASCAEDVSFLEKLSPQRMSTKQDAGSFQSNGRCICGS